jgi:hypothetical protein
MNDKISQIGGQAKTFQEHEPVLKYSLQTNKRYAGVLHQQSHKAAPPYTSHPMSEPHEAVEGTPV